MGITPLNLISREHTHLGITPSGKHTCLGFTPPGNHTHLGNTPKKKVHWYQIWITVESINLRYHLQPPKKYQSSHELKLKTWHKAQSNFNSHETLPQITSSSLMSKSHTCRHQLKGLKPAPKQMFAQLTHLIPNVTSFSQNHV